MRKLITIVIAFQFNLFLFAQTETGDTIYPSVTITPFEFTTSEPVNFPLGQATPVGDINGDGMGDLVFNNYVADERTIDPTDYVMKSVITTDTGIAGSAIVFYGSRVHGIGDYNGDGFDDILDISQKKIRFGCSEGIADDSLLINYPDYINNEIYYAGDINNDGMSEFFIGKAHNDTLLIFSGPDTIPILFISNSWQFYFDIDETLFYCYDYDMDGDYEICISNYSSFNGTRIIKWYQLDKINHQMVLEHTVSHNYIHEPSQNYPAAFSDIDGDQIIDIAHVYAEYDSVLKFHLEVCFGLGTEPYFDAPVEVEVGNSTRFLYNGGDFNNDGADDWYSKFSDDTIVVYYGNQNILTAGFQKEYYFTGINQLLLPQSMYYSLFYLSTRVPLLYYNDDSIADLFFNYWTYDSNLQHDIIGTAIVCGGDAPDFANPIVAGRSGYQTFEELLYGYSAKKIGDINQDGFDDWGILAYSGCYLEVYFGGTELDFEPDITFLLPQTVKAKCFDWTSGDMNGDGWIDIVISNSSVHDVVFVRSFMTEQSNVYIFFGGPLYKSVYNYEDADVVLHDNGTFYEYGKNTAIVGDYNADGYEDLVVGGGKHRHCLREAFVYFGGDEIGPEPDIVISVPCTQCGIAFAAPITPCGDINADGNDDFTLGDPNNGPGQSLVYYGGLNADSLFDLMIIHPVPNGIRFGSATARTKGDFDGDGYPDLIQYSYFAKEIYIYEGGPDFDQVYDQVIYDSTFPNFFHCIEYIDRSVETEASDILISYNSGNSYDFLVFSGGVIQNRQLSFILKNDLGKSGITIASGDFNNDSLTEIFTGISYEKNYGNPYGGVIYLYEPSVPVSIDNIKVSDQLPVKLFPNPASSTLNVEFSVDNPGPVVIRLTDMKGITHFIETRNSNYKGPNKIQINMGKWETGVYILEIQQEKSVKRKKFILLH